MASGIEMLVGAVLGSIGIPAEQVTAFKTQLPGLLVAMDRLRADLPGKITEALECLKSMSDRLSNIETTLSQNGETMSETYRNPVDSLAEKLAEIDKSLTSITETLSAMGQRLAALESWVGPGSKNRTDPEPAAR